MKDMQVLQYYFNINVYILYNSSYSKLYFIWFSMHHTSVFSLPPMKILETPSESNPAKIRPARPVPPPLHGLTRVNNGDHR